MADNRNGRMRARRKDPFRRAVGAPRKAVPAAKCPTGGCEHAEMAHEIATGPSDRPAVDRISCLVSDCDCGSVPS